MKDWNHITSNEEVNEIIKKSNDYPQIIFKDSVSCGISAFAKSRLVDGYDLFKDKVDFNYLDLLLAYRLVSDYIAKHLGVTHHSPQLIILKNEEVVYTSTHHSIKSESIAGKL